MARIERTTSPLPRECSATELHGRSIKTPTKTNTYHKNHVGAGEGNRTLVVSLEGFCSTIELHPPGSCHTPFTAPQHDPRNFPLSTQPLLLHIFTGGGGWIRTSVGVSQQIYSLPPLATRAPLQRKPLIMDFFCGAVNPVHLSARNLPQGVHQNRASEPVTHYPTKSINIASQNYLSLTLLDDP